MGFFDSLAKAAMCAAVTPVAAAVDIATAIPRAVDGDDDILKSSSKTASAAAGHLADAVDEVTDP